MPWKSRRNIMNDLTSWWFACRDCGREVTTYTNLESSKWRQPVFRYGGI
jgi:hypothetical protein